MKREVYMAGGFIEVELEEPPQALRLATRNNFDLNVADTLQNLGFIISILSPEGNMVLVATPTKILNKDWMISYQDKEQDPNLFTIYLDHGKGLYIDFLRQIKNLNNEYRVFFP